MNLMYCDQISCSGALDIIRMQLPASPVAGDSTSAPAQDVVLADVLVGSDGVARAIRIVN